MLQAWKLFFSFIGLLVLISHTEFLSFNSVVEKWGGEVAETVLVGQAHAVFVH